MEGKAFIESSKIIGVALLIVVALISWAVFSVELSIYFFGYKDVALLIAFFITLLPVIIIIWYMLYRDEKKQGVDNK